MTIISGETETYKLVEDVIVGGYMFFDDGLKGVNHYYEVQMTATVIDKSDYFTYHSLSVKPKIIHHIYLLFQHLMQAI